MRKRFFRVLKKYLIVLGAGILYFVFTSVTKIGIPCPFYYLTGLQCPGCGVSRMLMALLRFDFVSAFHYNPAVLLTAPIILFCILRSDVEYIQTGNRPQNQYRFVWITVLVILLGFGIIRNIV